MKRADSFLIATNLLAIFICLCLAGCQAEFQGSNIQSSPSEIPATSSESIQVETSETEPAHTSSALPEPSSSIVSPPLEKRPEIVLLDSIKTNAAQGMVLNSDFMIKDLSFDKVQSQLGDPDLIESDTDTGESFAYYNEQEVFFGFNSANMVFEIASTDDSLNIATLSMVGDYLGPADYEVFTAENEKISGYKVNSQYKLIFIFDAPTNANTNPPLKEYSVLYPAGTADSETGYAGRDW